VCDQETLKREAKGPSWTISACAKKKSEGKSLLGRPRHGCMKSTYFIEIMLKWTGVFWLRIGASSRLL
jgi:hypothetical protein